MKNKVYKGVKIIAFWAIVGVLITGTAKFLESKDSFEKYTTFGQVSDQVDVLFFGSSHMLNSVNPSLLYSEFGITSYNMAQPGGVVPESYAQLVNALDYSDPEYVVVDVWALDRDYHYVDEMTGTETEETLRNSVSLLHNSMDYWPLSINKIKTVNELIKDNATKMEFLCDFTLYHDRWQNMAEDTSVDLENEYLGSEVREEFVDPTQYSPDDMTQVIEGEPESLKYLYKIIDLCESRDIKLVVTFMPMATIYDQDVQAVNTVTQIAEERGFTFLNLLDDTTVIDKTVDMSDNTHVNMLGMTKISRYIGQFLTDTGDLTNHKGDSAYSKWDEIVSEWSQTELKELMDEDELYAKLGRVYNTNASIVLYVKNSSKIFNDEKALKIIKLLSGTSVIDGAGNGNGPYLMIRDTTNSQVLEYVGNTDETGSSALIGDFEYVSADDFGAVYLGGDTENNMLDMTDYYESELQLYIMGADGEVLQAEYYNGTWSLIEED